MFFFAAARLARDGAVGFTTEVASRLSSAIGATFEEIKMALLPKW